MNIFKYLKSKYRSFISTSLDEETDYQNLDLEQSKKIANTITISIIGLSGLTFVWLIFAKTDQIVIANGELQPTTRVRSIKLPISGVVEEVYVKEGNLVEKDEKLLKINDEGAISKIDYDAQKIKVLNYLNDLTNKNILIKVKTSELSQEIKFIQDNLFNYKTQLEEIEDILKYSIIKSPIAGYVYEINAKDKGFVIGANQDILKIVPQENLEALVFVNSKDIGFILTGQEVELNIDSYPAGDFGGVDGIISFISANSRKINDTDNNLFYEVKVTLNNQLIELNSGKNLPLKPGMSLSANIKLRRLSYLQLLFNLFTDKSRSIQQI